MMYSRSVNGIILILIYGLNSVNCEDDERFGKVLIFHNFCFEPVPRAVNFNMHYHNY